MLQYVIKHSCGSSLAVTFDVFGMKAGFRNESPVNVLDIVKDIFPTNLRLCNVIFA